MAYREMNASSIHAIGPKRLKKSRNGPETEETNHSDTLRVTESAAAKRGLRSTSGSLAHNVATMPTPIAAAITW